MPHHFLLILFFSFSKPDDLNVLIKNWLNSCNAVYHHLSSYYVFLNYEKKPTNEKSLHKTILAVNTFFSKWNVEKKLVNAIIWWKKVFFPFLWLLLVFECDTLFIPVSEKSKRQNNAVSKFNKRFVWHTYHVFSRFVIHRKKTFLL